MDFKTLEILPTSETRFWKYITIVSYFYVCCFFNKSSVGIGWFPGVCFEITAFRKGEGLVELAVLKYRNDSTL